MHLGKFDDCPECGAALTQTGYDAQACACGWGPWQQPSRNGLRVLVCGGRDFAEAQWLFDVLDAIHRDERIAIIIEGDAEGADRLAERWAIANNVHCAVVRAYWRPGGKLDRAAGHKRNAAMMHLRPDLVVAFPGGRGTEGSIALAMKAGITVMRPRR